MPRHLNFDSKVQTQKAQIFWLPVACLLLEKLLYQVHLLPVSDGGIQTLHLIGRVWLLGRSKCQGQGHMCSETVHM